MPLVNTFRQFRALRSSVKALVFLLWIYGFGCGMIGVFTQIFLYQKFSSVSLNVMAAILAYTGIMIGFCVPGFMAALWRINIKHGFILSYAITGASVVYFLYTASVVHAFAAMFLWGFGQGVFYLTVNTFELTETRDHERDFYSSVLNAGNQVLNLAGPACAVLLIWLSGSVLHRGTYTLLFTIAPLVFLLGFFYFSDIRDYRPRPIRLADVGHFLTDRKNQAAQLYTMGTGFQQMLSTVIPPLVVLALLGTALRVGVYNAFFAVFSALCLLVVAQYRTPGNRLLIYGVTLGCFAAATVWLGYAFSFSALIIYTVVEGVVLPVMSVSSHVIDLGSMEIGRKDSDFYATMILRDFFLWIWRSVGGVVLLAAIGFFGTEKTSLSMGLYLIAAGLLLAYAGAFFLIRERP